jgi:hypothetical protein
MRQFALLHYAERTDRSEGRGGQVPGGSDAVCFVPYGILMKSGLTCRNDKKAVVDLRMDSDDLDLMRGNASRCLESGKSMSQHLQDLGEML